MEDNNAVYLDYATICAIAEEMCKRTKLRELDDFIPIIEGMGGKIRWQEINEWQNQEAVSFECVKPGEFMVSLPKNGAQMNKVALLSALCHYIIHSQEGKKSIKIKRFDSKRAGQEGLWFALSVLIPDSVFVLSTKSGQLTDEVMAKFFRVPVELIGLKRKILKME